MTQVSGIGRQRQYLILDWPIITRGSLPLTAQLRPLVQASQPQIKGLQTHLIVWLDKKLGYITGKDTKLKQQVQLLTCLILCQAVPMTMTSKSGNDSGKNEARRQLDSNSEFK